MKHAPFQPFQGIVPCRRKGVETHRTRALDEHGKQQNARESFLEIIHLRRADHLPERHHLRHRQRLGLNSRPKWRQGSNSQAAAEPHNLEEKC
jgi:hypothetical protein